MPRPDPGAGTNPRPHPDPSAPPLGRRAAREQQAQREQAQREQGQREQAQREQGQREQAQREQRDSLVRQREQRDSAPRLAPDLDAIDPRRPAGDPSSPRRLRVATWLTVGALLLAAWSATTFVDSAGLLVAGPASLAPLVSILALPVIAVAVAGRHIVPTAIAVVAALLPWSLVTGYAAAGPGENEAGTRQTLRVMSVDGANGRASAKDIVLVTRLYEVDVVAVTDLTNALAHDLTVEGLASLAPARWVNVPAGDRHGTGLWARPKVDAIAPITGLSRPGVDGTIEAGANRIGITVVHLAGEPLNPGPAWRRDLRQLGDRTPPAPLSLIMGDLNASPWQPAFRRLTGSRWRDAADVVGQGLRPTWPSWAPLPIVPVDHVLVTPGLGVTGADSTAIVGSSHRALIVTLVLPRTGG
jgi:endonuclease/exonuclease/phosphatase (EEP) superfamily protein YafD